MNNKTLLALLGLLLLSGCASPAAAPTATPEPTVTPIPPTPTTAPTSTPDLPLTLTSAAFDTGGAIPGRYFYQMASGQCSGENVSPQLAWSGVPAETQSLAVISVDPDGSNWVHWVQFNIPPDTTELPEAVGGPEVGVKGRTYFYTLGYGGPCPPSGTHGYVFTLYAVDLMLPLNEGASYQAVMAEMEGHVLEQAELIGMGSTQP